MNIFRATAALSWAYLLEAWRTKPVVFWNVVFPLFFLVGLSYVFGRGEPARVSQIVPGILTMNLIAASFFGVSLYMVSLREKELYRRFSVTPLTSFTVLAAHSVTAFVNIAISALLQIAVAKSWFRIEILGSVLQLALAFSLAVVAFIPLGMLVGSVAKDMRSAPAISNLLFFPLTFLSGAAMPLYLMPEWMQRLAKLLPSTYVLELLQGVILRQEAIRKLASSVAILILTAIIGYTFDALLFRWEGRGPGNRTRLLMAIATLGVVYAVAFGSRLQLQSARAPEDQGGNGLRKAKRGARVLRGMTILDGLGGRIERGRITINSNRIEEVGDDNGTLPQGVPVTDYERLYVIPGLIDSHVHLGGSAGGSASPEEFMPARLVHDTQVYLAMGVTAIVSMADHVEDMERLRSEVAFGTMRAPRVFLSGPGLTAPNGHPAKLFSFLPGLADYMTRQVDSAESARKAVRDLAAMRVDFIKLYLEEGEYGQNFPVLSEEALRAAIRTAQELGLWSAVHVDNDRHARLAVEAGARCIEHIPPDLSDETIHAMVTKGTSLTPTLVASEAMVNVLSGSPVSDPLVQQWVEPAVLASLGSPKSWIARLRKSPEALTYYTRRYERQRAALRRAVSAGVTILAGTDAGNPATFHGLSLIRELELLVEEGGMTPRSAVMAASGLAGKRLGREDIGRITPGALADLVVLRADPSKDIRAIRSVSTVYFAGTPLQPETLLTTHPGNWTPLFTLPPRPN
jgi:imidazolonepropionase-like amidohydrolase/ABC-type multidrug transport system permease subunit